jgi:two-component system OmpR family sensor kinase
LNRLFWKILFTFWLSLLVIIGLLSLPNWLQQQKTQQLEDQLIAHPLSIVAIKAAATTFKHGGQAALIQMLREQEAEAPKTMQIYALDQHNRELLGRTVSNATIQAVRRYQADELSVPIVRQVTHERETLSLFAPWTGQFPEFNQKHHLNFSKKHQDDLLVALAIIIASFLASTLLARHFARPVQILERGFQALSTGQLSCRVAAEIGNRRDELADLGSAFDRMAQQLQQLLDQQKNLVDAQKNLLNDVSHELRSPLTRLNMSIALARQQPERLQLSLERIEQEAERLNKLVSEILTLSKLEAGINSHSLEYIDLITLLNMLVEASRFEAMTNQQSIDLQNHLNQEELLIHANGDLLYSALENIVRNAIQHTPAHSSIKIQLQQNQQQLQLLIEDNGAGLPADELDSIFESFRRSSQTQQNKGYGLGLAIAKRAIIFHGGRIQAKNRVEGGLQIEIILPLKIPH